MPWFHMCAGLVTRGEENAKQLVMKTEEVARLAIEHIQLRTEVQLLQKEHDIALREQQVKMQMAELESKGQVVWQSCKTFIQRGSIPSHSMYHSSGKSHLLRD